MIDSESFKTVEALDLVVETISSMDPIVVKLTPQELLQTVKDRHGYQISTEMWMDAIYQIISKGLGESVLYAFGSPRETIEINLWSTQPSMLDQEIRARLEPYAKTLDSIYTDVNDALHDLQAVKEYTMNSDIITYNSWRTDAVEELLNIYFDHMFDILANVNDIEYDFNAKEVKIIPADGNKIGFKRQEGQYCLLIGNQSVDSKPFEFESGIPDEIDLLKSKFRQAPVAPIERNQWSLGDRYVPS